MQETSLDHWFELALDLPAQERGRMLARLEREQPDVAQRLRDLLAAPGTNRAFMTERGSAAQPVLDTLHHVAIPVADIGAACSWYQQRFGCRVEYQDQSWALLAFANLRLALVMPGQHPPHFAITRPDAASFGPLTEHRDGTRSVYLRDPWGNAVEVLETATLADPETPSG